ncbi:hypothetical protein BDZ90DRAFT_257587 [Jaminaea rosea]|uniref:Cytochrome c oxidase subunit 8, mitochondrial n=1 Tax=Jaminaea rosea TaxID=1569628 RepID=A0A316UYW4_9BASI|nr:hypothetical protein BDZ90DRAFT_257587 [Jaminaea rosea]PWN30507.1 hypothetical protein BDZ90DRAFT_257587 [Jaminaea rosea]
MVSAILANASRQAARTSVPRGVRMVHFENTIDTAVPFKSGPKYKARLAVGITTFLISGFSLPFVAAAWQRYKQ